MWIDEFLVVKINFFTAGHFFTSWSCDQKNCPVVKNVISAIEKSNLHTENVTFIIVFESVLKT